MSRTHKQQPRRYDDDEGYIEPRRRPRRTGAERRLRVEPEHRPAHRSPAIHLVPDFIPLITRLANPSHDEPHRTPLLDTEVVDEWYAFVTHYTHGQARCVLHHFGSPSRFGEGICLACGATAWSPWWVADGVFGEGTRTYIANEEARLAAECVSYRRPS